MLLESLILIQRYYKKELFRTCIKEELDVKEYQHINAEQLEEAERIAAKYQGSCISKITIATGDIVAFKCRNKHIFRDTIKGANEKWCPNAQSITIDA